MSWFSRSVSGFLQGGKELLEGADEREEGEIEEEEEFVSEKEDVGNSSSGKGVREDLSELTKSLTKQLWGVASFLAPPPPPPKNEDPDENYEFSSSVHEQPQPTMESPPTDVNSSDEADSALHQMSDIFLEEEGSLPNRSLDELNPLDQSRQSNSSPHFTGMRSDWAELKGGIAKGLSHISSVMKVVAGEDLRESNLGNPTDSDDPSFTDKPKVSGFSSILRPLLANLHLDKGSGLSEVSLTVGNDETQGNSGAWESGELVNLTPTSRKSRFGFPSNLVSHIDGFSKLASSFIPFELEPDMENSEESLEAAGVTDEVITFADSISMHPETWLDFPHFDTEDDDDFEMTRLQQQHAQGIEYASPRIAALKAELCPHYMHEERFWKIYFVLLHSRLRKENSPLSSTPQVLEARSRLLQEMKWRGTSMPDSAFVSEERTKVDDKIDFATQTNVQVEANLGRNEESQSHGSAQKRSPQAITSEKVDHDLVGNNDSQDDVCHVKSTFSSWGEEARLDLELLVQKDASELPPVLHTGSNEDQGEVLEANRVVSVQKTASIVKSTHFVEEKSSMMKVGCSSTGSARLHSSTDEDEVEADEWLDEEQSNTDTRVGSTCAVVPQDDEDVSFSDLEDEDVGTSHMAGSSAKVVTQKREHSASGTLKSSELDTLNQRPERAESNDWLTVDEEDIASTGSS